MQAPIGQLPCVQVPVQQMSPEPQGAPAPRQVVAVVQRCVESEQVPVQQSLLLLQVPSTAAQIAPSPFLSGASGWPPPSPPCVGAEDPPHASAPATTIAPTDLDVKVITEVAILPADCRGDATRNPMKGHAPPRRRRTEPFTPRPRRFGVRVRPRRTRRRML